jgi:effector-binding domain-containing protein
MRSTHSGVLAAVAALAFSVTAFAQQAQAPAAPAPAPAPPAAAKDAFVPDVVKLPGLHVVTLAMKGSYLQHPEALQRLGGYLAGKGITPAGPPFGRYFSDPSVGEANLVWEVGFPVAEGVKVDDPYMIQDLPEALTAVYVHKGPMEEIGKSWEHLVQWVMSSGYQPLGPAMQVFKGDLMSAPEMELRFPISK